MVITADGGWRRGKEVPLKDAVDEALAECPGVRDVIVYRRTGGASRHERRAATTGGTSWTRASARIAPPSRSTASIRCSCSTPPAPPASPRASCTPPAATCCRPRMTMKWVFDLQEEDTYWCTADIGWVTGHSYIVYGPLSAGATTRDVRRRARLPAARPLVAHRSRSTGSTSSTPRRPPSARFIRQGDQWPNAHDLSSLRLLGSVGEPINPAAWEWYHRVIGKERCPIVDTWWQTETGAHHDRAHAGRGAAQARLRHAADAGHHRRMWSTSTASRWRRTAKAS